MRWAPVFLVALGVSLAAGDAAGQPPPATTVTMPAGPSGARGPSGWGGGWGLANFNAAMLYQQVYLTYYNAYLIDSYQQQQQQQAAQQAAANGAPQVAARPSAVAAPTAPATTASVNPGLVMTPTVVTGSPELPDGQMMPMGTPVSSTGDAGAGSSAQAPTETSPAARPGPDAPTTAVAATEVPTIATPVPSVPPPLVIFVENPGPPPEETAQPVSIVPPNAQGQTGVASPLSPPRGHVEPAAANEPEPAGYTSGLVVLVGGGLLAAAAIALSVLAARGRRLRL